MAKFCNKCGKPLVDGKCSHCEQTEKEVVESTSEENLFIEYLNVLKGMFTHPVATIKKEATAKKSSIRNCINCNLCNIIWNFHTCIIKQYILICRYGFISNQHYDGAIKYQNSSNRIVITITFKCRNKNGNHVCHSISNYGRINLLNACCNI